MKSQAWKASTASLLLLLSLLLGWIMLCLTSAFCRCLQSLLLFRLDDFGSASRNESAKPPWAFRGPTPA
jgi:hypothetical protein